MAWRYVAKKGFITRRGGARKKEAIEGTVSKLRANGYKVRVYQV